MGCQNCITFLVGLGHLYHAGNIHPPIVIRKLVNLHSFGQLEDVTAIADVVADDPDYDYDLLPKYEACWWSPFPNGAKLEPVVPEVLFECWNRQGTALKPRKNKQTPDYLDLLPLSRQDLHSAFRTSEQLVQEASMESIETLKHIRALDTSIVFVEELMHKLDIMEDVDR